MLNMQAFHQSLRSTTKASNPRQNHLANLTRVKRDQILALTSELVWNIWSEEPGASAPQ